MDKHRSNQQESIPQNEIEERAYHLWEKAGKPQSDGKQFYEQAEKELQQQQKNR